MEVLDMSKNKSGGNMGAKGYYIALALCAVIIGISGYFFFRNTEPEASLQNEPTSPVSATVGRPSAVTQPLQSDPTDPTAPTTKPAPKNEPMKTAAPLQGEVVAAYAMDSLRYNQTTRDWRVHSGVDYAAQAGTPVCAAADGEVYTVYEDDTMGFTVVLRHGEGYTTCYSSLGENIPVKTGDKVKLGQPIGYVGDTALLESALGDHLCFRVLKNDVPVDPAEFLS